MKSHRCDDWGDLVGVEVDILRRGRLSRVGVVDAVTANGAILWLAADQYAARQLFDSADGYEAWVDPHDVQNDFNAKPRTR